MELSKTNQSLDEFISYINNLEQVKNLKSCFSILSTKDDFQNRAKYSEIYKVIEDDLVDINEMISIINNTFKRELSL